MMKKILRSWFQSIAIAAILLIAAFNAHAKTASEIYEQAAKSTVVVSNIDDTGKAQSFGSGVVLSDGSVVTNCHVVKNSSQLKVRNVKVERTATLRYSDWNRDICSLTVGNIGAQAVKVGNTKTLKVGAKVYAIGAPRGLELTLSDGIVSGLREVEGGHYIQTTAAISPGSSGGGLFDENGALVGLTTFYFTEGQNLNFAVPVEWVNELPKHSTEVSALSQSDLDWLNKYIELEKNKDFPILLEYCLRWAKAQPNNILAWLDLGIAYYAVGQPTKAIESFQHSIRINPNVAGVWGGLGIVFASIGQPIKAIEAYQHGLSINPDDENVLNALSRAYYNTDQNDKAIEVYQHSLRINPESEDAWFNLGRAYFKAVQISKATDAFLQTLRINPENPDAWNALGKSYFKTDQNDKAIEAYQRALIIDPEFAEGWFNLGIVYFNTNQNAKAIDACQQALRINPDYAGAWMYLGQSYFKANQPTKFIEAIQQVLRIEPRNSKVWFLLGTFYSKEGQRDKVFEVYKQLKPLDSGLAERLLTIVVH